MPTTKEIIAGINETLKEIDNELAKPRRQALKLIEINKPEPAPYMVLAEEPKKRPPRR